MISKKYSYIDSLRGIAVILVLISHFRYSFSANLIKNDKSFNFLFSIFDYGGKGVQLFYILSAFTLFNSYYFRKKNGNSNIIFFYLRRIFRIAPLFYICLFLMILNNNLQLFQNDIFFSKRLDIDQINYEITNIKEWYLTTLFFINGFFPKYIQSPYPGGWSIAVEFSFYLLIPLFVKLITTLRKSFIFLIFCFILSFSIESILIIFKIHGVLAEYLILSLFHQLYFFAIGILVFFIQNETYNISWKSLISIISIITLTCLIRSPHLISAIIFFTIIYNYKKINFLKFNWIQYIGKISFSLYLIQWWIIIFITKINNIYIINIFILFIIYIFLCVFLASITYKIEKYFINKGEILISKI